jgi:hypothetical protein
MSMKGIARSAFVAALAVASTPSSAGIFGFGLDAVQADKAGTRAVSKTAAKARYSTDFSDLWWNQSESGWGAQLVQNNGLIFATVFVYGVDGRPTWFTAQLHETGNFTWTGPLYSTTGPWFASVPFDSSAVGVRQAGTMTFHAATIASGTLEYSVDGVSVTKSVTRQTLVRENIGGTYDVALSQNQTCVYPLSSGSFTGLVTMNFAQSGDAVIAQTFNANGGVECTLTGTYSQSGKMGSVTGTYSCPSGEAGSFSMFEITVTENGILARVAEQSNYCSAINGSLAGNRR